MDPASGGYPLIDGMGVQQQQQGQQVQQQQQQGIVNNDMALMANLIDDAIGIQGQDQSGGGSALLGGMLSHMPSFNSIAPPPPPTATAITNTATGISSAEGQRDESTSQDFSNTAAPPSGEDNQSPRIEDGINQSQQVGADEQKTNPATSALDSVAAESSPQGPVLNEPQDNESPPLADGTNFVTASTIASAESQSFSSTGNNIANNNAVQGQISQTTVNAKWPSQQEQEQQQQVVQQPPAQQAVQLALSHMPSFNSIAPPPPPTANATTATGISSAEGQRDESTSQDFSNTAAPPSGEDNQSPRIEDGINQSQQVGADEQKTNPATSALDSVAAESSPQGPVLNEPQDNESPPLADGTNFVTASTIASAESQSFSSTGNNIANNNAVQGQISQTTVNAKWPSQQEQEQQQQVVQQPPAQQAVQLAVQSAVQQPIQATQQQLMMNAMLTNPAQLQVINPQAYYLWLCQQAQQPVQAPGIIQGQDIASTAAAAATAVQQPTVAISQLMLQLQAQQQQASQQQIQQSRLLQASQALAVQQSQLQQAAQLQQQAAAAHSQVPQAAIPTSSTTVGNNYKPISSIPPGQKKKKSKFSGVF